MHFSTIYNAVKCICGEVMLSFIVFVCVLIWKVYSQNCVPIGTCPTNPGNSNAPDIRIITPGATVCPPGTIPCPLSPSTSNCGIRNTQVTDADGISQPGAFPWQVYMVNQSMQYFGSGALLNGFYVLTAAHKVADNRFSPGNIKVYLGVWDPRYMNTAANRTAAGIIIHPSFNPNNLFNNIALVRLDSPAPIGQNPMVGCIVLPNSGVSYVGRRCWVAGWGQTTSPSSFSYGGPLKQVSVPIVDYQTCRAAHSSPSSLGSMVDSFLDPVGDICAGGEAYKDACTNDGGAPLACSDQTGTWTVVGLVIWGKGCGVQGLYGVYTNVANYRSWMDSALSANAG